MPFQRVLKFVGLYLAASIFAAAGMLFYAAPYHPKSLSGWTLFFLLALPITFAGEAIGEAVWRNRIAKKIESGTAGRPISGRRMGYVFVAMLLLFAISCAVVSLLGL